MRIAHIAPLFQPIPPQGYGGTEICIANLAVEQAAHGNFVTVFASGDSNLLEYAKEMLEEQGYTITKSENRYHDKSINIISPDGNKGKLTLSPVIEKSHGYDTPYTTTPKIKAAHMALEREANFDVINSHINLVDLPIWEAKGMQDKVVTTLHYGVNKDIYPYYPDANSICISHDQEELAKEIGVKTRGVVHHGLPKDQYAPNLGETSNYLVFLGHVGEEKGLKRAMEIAEKAGKPLVIGGKIRPQDQEIWDREFAPKVRYDPDFLNNPEQKLAGDDVVFVGEVDVEGKQKILSNAEALLFPISWREPFGMVMIEANACCTPIVGFNHFDGKKCGSVDEIIQDGINGFKATSVEEAVEKVQQLDTISRSDVFNDFSDRFQTDRVAQEYEAIYEDLIQERKNNKDHNNLKISFCTAVKGDQYFKCLKETLPQNISDNKDHDNVEFVILDYNSGPELGEWIRENFEEELHSGLVRYARTEEPEHWKMSHAKNMASRLATGDVLVNVDADNFTGPSMASWLNKAFKENPDIIVRPSQDFRKTPGNESSAGRIAISKPNFEKIHGYDEPMCGWGKEDTRLVDCAARNGIHWRDMPANFVSKTISQTNEERVANYSDSEKEQSLAAINATKDKSWANGIKRKAERLHDRMLGFVNEAGNVGCGNVYVNFSKTPEVIEPLSKISKAEIRSSGIVK